MKKLEVGDLLFCKKTYKSGNDVCFTCGNTYEILYVKQQWGDEPRRYYVQTDAARTHHLKGWDSELTDNIGLSELFIPMDEASLEDITYAKKRLHLTDTIDRLTKTLRYLSTELAVYDTMDNDPLEGTDIRSHICTIIDELSGRVSELQSTLDDIDKEYQNGEEVE